MKIKVKRLNPKTVLKIKIDGFIPNDGEYLIELLTKLEVKSRGASASFYEYLCSAISSELNENF